MEINWKYKKESYFKIWINTMQVQIKAVGMLMGTIRLHQITYVTCESKNNFF